MAKSSNSMEGFREKIFGNGGEINKSRAESEMGSLYVLLEA